MRGASRRGSDAVDVSLHNFAWPRATMAVLRHPTLPWNERFAPHIELSATPLAEIRNAGARDRLSLAGQFAAHIAVLQFAGISDVDFDPGEWAVIRKRGSDWRLVRIAARAAEAEASPTALQHVQQFADAVAVPSLDVLRQSWTRAESVFAEVFRRLRSDATADMRWLQHCAAGEILSPGAEALSAMWTGGGPFAAGDVDAFKAYATLDDSARLLVAGTEFPIQRYAALASIDASLVGSSLSPAAVADRLFDRFAATRHVIVISGRLDDDSRRVVEILKSGAADAEPVQAERRWIVLSTRLAAQRAIEERLATVSNPRRWLDEFVTSTAYDEYLSRGVLPVDGGGFATTPEPRRSYIAALALLGTRIPRSLAQDFLRQFLFEQPLEELVIDGVTFADAEQFAFSSDEVRDHCATHIPAASRPALCRAAASVADALRGGLLLIESGETERGVALLESVHWSGAGEVVTALGSLPRTTLTPQLARTLASALVDSGRYRDAREIASAARRRRSGAAAGAVRAAQRRLRHRADARRTSDHDVVFGAASSRRASAPQRPHRRGAQSARCGEAGRRRGIRARHVRARAARARLRRERPARPALLWPTPGHVPRSDARQLRSRPQSSRRNRSAPRDARSNASMRASIECLRPSPPENGMTPALWRSKPWRSSTRHRATAPPPAFCSR